MDILEVLNVGQGDCFILRPVSECVYKEETVLIDLGPGKYDITKNIKEYENVHIILTHHDNDHIAGMRFFIGKMHQVKEITVPFYQNEITLIARAILNLKGISVSRDCNEFIKGLEEIVNNQVMVKSIVERGGLAPKLSFAYEEKEFCRHIQCFNPPMLMDTYDWLAEMTKKDLKQIIYQIFNDKFAEEMLLYITFNGYVSRYRASDYPEFERFWLYGEEVSQGVNYTKCNYVINFIMNNLKLFRDFNDKATRSNLRKIYTNYVKTTHDVCTVLKTSYRGKTVLLTGDASKKVFNRLINEKKDITATYLKMPHHGSKYNMNKKILKKINPKKAIISHDNGHFGSSLDTHPNQEILDLLEQEKVGLLITNDVIKQNIVIKDKRLYSMDSYVHIR